MPIPARWSGAASSSTTTSGTTTPTPPPVLVDIDKDGQTIPALVQSTKQGFLFVLNRADRRADLSDRGEAGAALRRAGRAGRRRPSPMPRLPRADRCPTAWPGISTLADIAELRLLQPQVRRSCATTAGSRRRASRARWPIPATAGGVEWGGGAVDPTHRHLRRQQLERRADLSAASHAQDYDNAERKAGQDRLLPA